MKESTTKPTGKDYVGSDDLYADVQRTMQLAAEMNTGWHNEADVRDYLHEITGSPIPDTVRVFPPFNINYGRTTTFGKDSFVNFGCTFLALGGITIEDGAFIGPHCVLATNTTLKTQLTAMNCAPSPSSSVVMPGWVPT